MILGRVDERLQAILPVELIDNSHQMVAIEAVIDTGFSGFLTLPDEWISRLGLPRAGAREARLGNGEIVQFDVYTATVRWHDREQPIIVLASEAGVLVGMSLLEDDRVTIDVFNGGQVSIAPIR